MKNELYIVITSDRGLCGGYNTNLVREVVSGLKKGAGPSFIVTGTRGATHLRSAKHRIIGEYPGISDSPQPEHAAEIADTALGLIKRVPWTEYVLPIQNLYPPFPSSRR